MCAKLISELEIFIVAFEVKLLRCLQLEDELTRPGDFNEAVYMREIVSKQLPSGIILNEIFLGEQSGTC